MTIDIIAGARPNFMKIAPIIKAVHELTNAVEEKGIQNSRLSVRLIHTGQHYDRNMSGSFFEQLGIPEPDVNLGAGGGTQAEQTAAIMTRYERLLDDSPADLCLVVGDVTSTLACAIVGKKKGLVVAHVEGGLRSYDLSMPEEINRMVTDSISDYFYTTSELAGEILRREGHPEDRIVFVGNTMIDTLMAHRHRFTPPAVWSEASLQPGRYLLLTMHRPANVDGEEQLAALIREIMRHAGGRPVVFPVHPRTRQVLDRLGLDHPGLILSEPLDYFGFQYLLEQCQAVITDSGGITEEACIYRTPCLTLRDNTERPETITLGTNELIGTDPAAIGPALARVFSGQWKKGQDIPLWDGQAALRIVAHLVDLASHQ